jgi:predicted RNase H-like HicB family nuclease
VRYTVILVPDELSGFGVSVPALPGCVSAGQTRDDALAHVREAIAGWLEVEAATGLPPPTESPAVIAAGVVEALQIVDDMRAAGEIPTESGYDLELSTVEVQPPVVA